LCSSNPEAVQTALFTGTLINRREGANAWQQPYGFQFLSLGAAILAYDSANACGVQVESGPLILILF